MSEKGRLRGTRRMMERAVGRLNLFEYVLMGGAAIVALLGGAGIAWILQIAVGIPFRVSWFVASLLLFVLPGAAVLRREARAESKKDEIDG
ncbi:MAG: hypothetical protein BMS9Abin29_0561 [Gemmatimonadota bacterium]|nr:MAG: hypothetical protein BMS9Abin29_0561 [Gemmatimonadota bacterium]